MGSRGYFTPLSGVISPLLIAVDFGPTLQKYPWFFCSPQNKPCVFFSGRIGISNQHFMKLSEISMTRWWFQFFPCLSRIPREMIWFDNCAYFSDGLVQPPNQFFLPPNKNPCWMRRFLRQAMFVGCFSISSMFSGAPWCRTFLGKNILIG